MSSITEIEQQLEMAENRCNTLKGQVDYMKMLYNGMNKENDKPNKMPQLPKQSVNKRPQMMTADPSGGKRKRANLEPGTSQISELKDPKFMTIPTEETPSRDVDTHHFRQHYGTVSNMSTIPQRDKEMECDASAAVKSINNIISGITNSVNRLTQLQVQIGPNSSANLPNNTHHAGPHTVMGIQNIKCAPRMGDFVNPAPEKPYPLHFTKNEETKSTESIKSKLCKKKRKLKNKTSSKPSMTSVADGKKKIKVTAKHTEKKTRLNQSGANIGQFSSGRRRPFGKLRTITSRTMLMKKTLSIKQAAKATSASEWKSDKLIELYHNSAAKIVTASEDSLPKQKVQKPKAEIKREATFRHPVSANVYDKPNFDRPGTYDKQSVYDRQNYEKHTNFDRQSNYDKQESSIIAQQHQYRTPLSPIHEQEGIPYGGSYYRNNYELPTIASKMKQVAKSYFENFNFRSIPFVAARSITPSHNLGINIQQVLSIIKGRKPIAGISPTLAYNIELAANKLGSRPLSALVSNLGSRLNTTTNKNYCPLARKYPFSHMQELAKEIPEETVEEMAADYEDDTKTVQDIGAGDKDADPANPNSKRWYIDNKKSDKCTCVPKPGVSFNDVYNKYLSDDKIDSQCNQLKGMKRLRNKPWNDYKKTKAQMEIPAYTKSNQINQRERSLKEVLKNLHDEFALLNERYEDLKAETCNDKTDSSILVNELEKMEKDLQNKEDEITTVMSLYKEVLQLKQQVKVLKNRASQSTVTVSPLVNKNRDYRDLNAAGHLTKLLRHIQQFQETLKNKSSR